MKPPIDTDSIVFTEDAPQVVKQQTSAPLAGVLGPNYGSQTILPDIDVDSITFEDDSKLLGGPEAQVSAAPPQKSFWERTQNISDTVNPADLLNPVAFGSKVAQGAVEEFGPDITRETPEQGIARSQNIYAMSKASGVPMEDVSKHYQDLAKLQSVTGIDRDPTSLEVLEKSMAAGLVPAMIAAPVPTALGLLGYMALDTLVPTDKFIPEDVSPGARDTIGLVGMLAKGALVGGLFHMSPKASKPAPSLEQMVEFPAESLGRFRNNTVEIFKKFTRQKLKEKGLPDTIIITPDQLKKLEAIEVAPPEPTPLQRARAEIATVQSSPRVRVTQDLSLSPETVRTAIDTNSNVKIPAENLVAVAVRGEQHLAAVQEILSPSKRLEAPAKPVEAAPQTFYHGTSSAKSAKAIRKNGFSISKQAQEGSNLLGDNLVEGVHLSKSKAPYEEGGTLEGAAHEVFDVTHGAKNILKTDFKGIGDLKKEYGIAKLDPEGSTKLTKALKKDGYDGLEYGDELVIFDPKSVKLVKAPTPENLTPVGSEGGKIKQSRMAERMSENAVERGLAAFDDLPEYKTMNKKDQSAKANKLLKADPEYAMRIALGKEAPPGDILPEAVMIAVREKAKAEGDVSTLRDIAVVGNLSMQETAMGQRLSLLAERSPEDPVSAMKAIKTAREQRAVRNLKKGETLEKVTEKVVKEMKKEVKKTTANKQDWAAFIKELEC